MVAFSTLRSQKVCPYMADFSVTISVKIVLEEPFSSQISLVPCANGCLFGSHHLLSLALQEEMTPFDGSTFQSSVFQYDHANQLKSFLTSLHYFSS